MEFHRPSKSAGEMFDDLKGRLGFGGNRNDYDPDDSYDDGGYDGFEPDAGYDENLGYNPDDYADPYDRLEYTTRSSSSSYRRGRSVSSNLVNSSDIRAAAIERSYEENPAPHVAHEQREEPQQPIKGFNVPATAQTDFVSPYQARAASGSSGFSGTASSGRTGSAGLDSLFTPSTGVPASGAQSSVGQVAGSSFGRASAGPREVVLVEPRSYEDVANVAASVRKGSIVVLSLRATEPSLSRRVLDFSFGVASALDAKVDCVAKKTFTIIQGAPLSEVERLTLGQQGLL